MLKGEIRPIIKNANSSRNVSKNYRPVMNSSNFLKIFDYCILSSLGCYIMPNVHQFGFRKNTNCVTAITILKETVQNYNRSGSKVHCAMVDLSKAFDMVNHNILLSKLREKGIPLIMVKILRHMLENTYVNVSFGGFKGEDWKVNNGVRQGGILSPYLFNLYIDELIDSVSKCDIGCKLGVYPSNIICYADDILLCAPTATGLQCLVGMVCDKLNDLCLPINDKSVYILFNSKVGTNRKFSLHINEDILENSTECVYLGTVLSEDFKINLDVRLKWPMK